MQGYKRNQVEEAIAAALDPDVAAGADLRIRLKRLLDADRTLSCAVEANDPKRLYAFYSGAPPGRGMEVWFSSYEAFALLLGLFLLEHRWPQGTAVRILRRARPELAPAHARILTQDPQELFDEATLAKQAAPGRPALASTDPVFLAIVSGSRRDRLDPEVLPHAIHVCDGEAALGLFRRGAAPPGTSMTVLELTAPAHVLARCLEQTTPRTRGRPSR